MARDGLISWRLTNARAARAPFQEMIARTAHPERAFDKMLDVIAKRQEQWFNSEGSAGGNQRWARRRGRYAEYMARHYPGRPVLVGPDTKGHKGGQLRKELTQRPFGRERISPKGFAMGSDLPYSIVHQQGQNELPRRRPLRPMDSETVAEFRTILARHITVSQKNYAAGKRP